MQRSIGYGLRGQGAVEDSGTVPLLTRADMPGRSPAAVAAMEGALERAGRRDDPRVGGRDLLAAPAADPGCRAVEILTRAGVDTPRRRPGSGSRLNRCNGPYAADELLS